MNFRILKLLFLLGLLCLKANAVIFASDGVLFQGQAHKVVILRDGDKFHLCETNSFFVRQGPNWNQGPYEIALIDKALVADKHDNPNLKKLFQNSKKRFSFTLPTLQESPAIRKSATGFSPKKGTGGLIGAYRYFIFNLSTFKLEQVSDNVR